MNSCNILLLIRCLDDKYMNNTNNTNVVDDVNFIYYEINSEKETYEVYCRYANKIGFSVRRENYIYWSNSKKVNDKNFVCSKMSYKKGLDLNSHLKYQKSKI